jgi:hypothetical protein
MIMLSKLASLLIKLGTVAGGNGLQSIKKLVSVTHALSDLAVKPKLKRSTILLGNNWRNHLEFNTCIFLSISRDESIQKYK